VSPADPRWVWIVYATLLVPIVGPGLLIVWSSVVYYVWRRKFPEAAARLNRHAWIAVAISVSLNVAWLVLVRR
jgi:hypothetical protein